MDPQYIAQEALEFALAKCEELADDMAARYFRGEYLDMGAFTAHLKHTARYLREAEGRLYRMRRRIVEALALIKRTERWKREREEPGT